MLTIYFSSFLFESFFGFFVTDFVFGTFAAGLAFGSCFGIGSDFGGSFCCSVFGLISCCSFGFTSFSFGVLGFHSSF
jgi:hypothetical protein